jgi:WD40 repeat protein
VNRGNAAAGVEGSVSVVNLQTNQVTATIAATSNAAATQDFDTSPTLVYGHPNSVSVSLASPTGKVYITSSDNKFMTVLRTDTDAVTTHITLQGLGLRVLVSAP